MAGSMENPSGGVEHFVLADAHSPRMRQICSHLFDICQELVDVGLMETDELSRRMGEAQSDPAMAMQHLAELDPVLT